MAKVEILMPKMGESIMEGSILSWLKKVGESVGEEEAILEVATDKVDTEIQSTHSGTITELLAEEGDVVSVGCPIAIIETGSHEPKAAPMEETETAGASTEVQNFDLAIEKTEVTTDNKESRFLSPLVKNIAKEENISNEELNGLIGTGKDGRITRDDILGFVKSKNQESAREVTPKTAILPIIPTGEDEIIQMDRMRKIIAERMLDSKRVSPHVTSFVEADVTNIVNWRSVAKKKYQDQYQTKLTYLPIMVNAVVRTITEFPMINIQVNGDRIIKKAEINM